MDSNPFRLFSMFSRSEISHSIPPSMKKLFGSKFLAPIHRAIVRRPELLLFGLLLAFFNAPVLVGSCWHSLMFRPDAVQSGQWWRLFTHPFVHLTWYHLLLDGVAFLTLYNSLLEIKFARRLTYIVAAAVGSLSLSWLTTPAGSGNGLCGLSGIAHGLMAVSALEIVASQPPHSTERRIGWFSFSVVVGKAAFEVLTGRMFFNFLDFGLLGSPVVVSHAGGIVGSLIALLFLRPMQNQRSTQLPTLAASATT
ncbi:MAG: hypothetical protein JWQ71_2338 [Pedosphaera sp.]|nr:hypothetical protein [Pedosphaera sp.]